MNNIFYDIEKFTSSSTCKVYNYILLLVASKRVQVKKNMF